jgi:hypothetical protein
VFDSSSNPSYFISSPCILEKRDDNLNENNNPWFVKQRESFILFGFSYCILCCATNNIATFRKLRRFSIIVGCWINDIVESFQLSAFV